jgi:cysteine-S-conjugate beta-lyase
MRYDFDAPIDRRHSDSTKWHYYPPEVLPLWTADMDFQVPAPVIQALQERMAHGIFGYGIEPPELREILVERMSRLYGWKIAADCIVFVPGVVTGFNRVCRIAAGAGDAVLVQPPVYPPILAASGRNRMERRQAQLSLSSKGRYEIDFEAFEAAISERTRVYILCNPHNPVGRAFTEEELGRIAEICLRRNVLVCSDEIHCDLVYPGFRHIPIASLDPQVAFHSITLMAPSKTFNIPGLHCAFAIVPDPALRKKLVGEHTRHFPEVNIAGLTAALAAYRDGEEWLSQVMLYLEGNRDFLEEYVRREFVGIRMQKPEATYLAWLDCRESGIEGNVFQFFLERAKVGLYDGQSFGSGGSGFLRINFACTRATLTEALEKMKAAFAGR